MSSIKMQTPNNTNPLFDAYMSDKLIDLQFTTTENGAGALTNYGLKTKEITPSYVAPIVALSTELVRGNESKKPIKKGVERGDYDGISRVRVGQLIYEVFVEIKKYGFSDTLRSDISKKILSDLVKIMFNIRDIRGTYGKGERRIFLWMMVEINRYLPDLVYWLLTFIPHYGSYKDLADLYELVHVDETSGQYSTTPCNLIWPCCDKMHKKINIKTSIVEMFAHALKKDIKEFSRKDELAAISISLAARWVPKEGRALAKITRSDSNGSITMRIATKLYPIVPGADVKSSMAKFRRTVVSLNKYLDTVQIKMSSNKFSEIEFDKLPGRATVKFQKAWRGVDKTGTFIHMSNPDRVTCCENYTSFLSDLKSGKTSAKGKQLHIHELVNKLDTYLNQDEIELYNAQFKSHVDDIIQHQKDSGIVVKPYVPMADVSGSMMGDPMSVSIGMAILCSHPGIAHPVWENIVLPFSTNPSLIKLQYPSTLAEWESSKSYSSSKSIYSSSTVLGITFDPRQAGRELTPYEKVKVIKCMDWGQSTNFTGAFSLLANLANRTGTTMPNCLVISDMQFNCASIDNNTYSSFNSKSKVDSESNIFSKINLYKKPLIKTLNEHLITEPCGPCNRCVFWNVRGGTENHPCGADDIGLIEVGGFSSNMIKLFLYDGTLESPNSAPSGTSWESLRTMIDCDDYEELQDFINVYSNPIFQLKQLYTDSDFIQTCNETEYIDSLTLLLRVILKDTNKSKLTKNMRMLLDICPDTWAKNKCIDRMSPENSTDSEINIFHKVTKGDGFSIPKLTREIGVGNKDILSEISFIEHNLTGKTSCDLSIIQRINELENVLFGKIQEGTILQRVNYLYLQVSV